MSHKGTLGTAPTPHIPVLLSPQPAVLWDRVTLTCQGSGTAGATTWYTDGRRWWQQGPSHVTVSMSGTYTLGTGRSPPVTVLHEHPCARRHLSHIGWLLVPPGAIMTLLMALV
uniref:Uncharacterized protein n=1 Tax=Geospiza parvula TaxID=87175 RepID=A0A8U8BBI4_GEOPR